MYKILGTDQNEYGPASVAELRQWIAEGRVVATTPVRPDGSANWSTAAQMPELAGLFGAASPSPAAAGPKTSGLAVASLVLSLLGCTSFFGLICGIIALVKIGRSQGRLGGKGLAIAGICVSGLIMLLSIPITAALVLPAVAKAKGQATSVACANNVKQLSLAVMMYANDNSDTLPKAENWCDALTRYTGGGRTFVCPAQKDGQRAHYAYNTKLSGKKQSEVNPQTVLIFENSGGWNKSGGPESLQSHHQRIIVGFADGSVRQISRDQLGTLRWDP